MRRRLAWCTVAVSLLLAPGAALGQGRLLVLPTSDLTLADADPSEPGRVDHVLSAGIGQTTERTRLVAWLGFDLVGLPASTPFRTVVIDEARLSLMATSFGLASARRRFLVTIRSCDGAAWSPAAVTWREPPCREPGSETSVLVAGSELPRAYEWDVARGVARAARNEAAGLTFAIAAAPLVACDRDPFEGIGCRVDERERIGFVRFASSAREAYGIGAVPHLTVRYSLEPTALRRVVELVLSLMSALALTLGLYKSVTGLLGGRRDQATASGPAKVRSRPDRPASTLTRP